MRGLEEIAGVAGFNTPAVADVLVDLVYAGDAKLMHVGGAEAEETCPIIHSMVNDIQRGCWQVDVADDDIRRCAEEVIRRPRPRVLSCSHDHRLKRRFVHIGGFSARPTWRNRRHRLGTLDKRGFEKQKRFAKAAYNAQDALWFIEVGRTGDPQYGGYPYMWAAVELARSGRALPLFDSQRPEKLEYTHSELVGLLSKMDGVPRLTAA